MKAQSINTQGIRSTFMVLETTETSARLEDSTGFRFDAPRQYIVDGETHLLKTGQLISADIKLGTETSLENIFVESPIELSERKEFDGAGPDTKGFWEPYSNPPPPAGTMKEE